MHSRAGGGTLPFPRRIFGVNLSLTNGEPTASQPSAPGPRLSRAHKRLSSSADGKANYEVYNQDNVVLVDLRETPIKRITPKGIKTSAAEYEFDVIIFATGFDAVTRAFNRIDIRGVGRQALKEKWADGPRTYLGVQSVGFPNLFTLVGPHNGATFCNIPRCSEQNVEWVTECIRYMRAPNHERIEAKLEAEGAWTEHVTDTIATSLLLQADS